MMQTEKILFVDDESNLLDGIRRQLRREFALTMALSGADGIRAIETEGPFAVIVSDMRMPGMDGIQFLGKAQELSPDSVRIMLTGNADVTTAVKAVNEGRIFRFLAKPCPPIALQHSLRAALEQYRLVTAERELLEKTLHGSVRLMTDLLGMANPVAFGRASRVKGLVKRLTILADGNGDIKKDNLWEYELAAMLSQIGTIVLPPELSRKVREGTELVGAEKDQYNSHTKIASDLIANIPRLEDIATVVIHQNRSYDGSGEPLDAPRGAAIPTGARLLKVALDYDTLVSSGSSPAAAVATLQERSKKYDPAILDVLKTLIGLEAQYEVKKLPVKQLKPSMILAEDISTTDGQLLISKGFELTDSIIQRLEHFARSEHLHQPICVLAAIEPGEPSPPGEALPAAAAAT